MRLRLFPLCSLVVALASVPIAEASSPRFSAGPRVGFGGLGLPGLGAEPARVNFGGVVEATLTRRDALIAGVERQRVESVRYDDAPQGLFAGNLTSAYVGLKHRLGSERVRPYFTTTLGITRWSGRPGDSEVSPTIGGLIGGDVAVAGRSRVFAEAGLRYGRPDRLSSVPRWSFGLGYALGF